MPTEAYAHGGLCPRRPMPYIKRAPHVAEKGYSYDRASLEIYPKQVNPATWAAIQNNLKLA